MSMSVIRKWYRKVDVEDWIREDESLEGKFAGTKKRTGDGAAAGPPPHLLCFLIVIGCLVLADGVGMRLEGRKTEIPNLKGNIEQKLSGKSDSDASEPIWQ